MAIPKKEALLPDLKEHHGLLHKTLLASRGLAQRRRESHCRARMSACDFTQRLIPRLHACRGRLAGTNKASFPAGNWRLSMTASHPPEVWRTPRKGHTSTGRGVPCAARITYGCGYGYDLRRLTLSISRADNNQLVWRGMVTGNIKTDAASGDLTKAAEGILVNFPPKWFQSQRSCKQDRKINPVVKSSARRPASPALELRANGSDGLAVVRR
jgi:hypothetical protein